MIRPVDAVIEFLTAEQARGTSHILLDKGAKEGLRDLYRRSQTSSKPAALAPVSTPPAKASAAIPSHLTIEGSSKAEQLASLRKQAEAWPAAKALGTLRETMVFATGNPDAAIMLVGDAPGYEEEKKAEPFVGPAGQKLNDILKAMGLSRDSVYISNIVKFRPSTPRQTTNNRKPDADEIAVCMPFIRAEINIVRPACIIALGSVAAEGLLGKTNQINTMRSSWHEFEGIPVRVTYHPSYLLRSDANLSVKRQTWEDMLAVMERLEMPISTKQRAYFLPKS